SRADPGAESYVALRHGRLTRAGPATVTVAATNSHTPPTWPAARTAGAPRRPTRAAAAPGRTGRSDLESRRSGPARGWAHAQQGAGAPNASAAPVRRGQRPGRRADRRQPGPGAGRYAAHCRP